MAEVLLRRRSGLILAPADGLAELEIEGFPMGRDLLCTLKRARSAPNLRHYFACLTRLAEAIGMEDPKSRGKHALDQMLRIECGLVTPIRTQTGGLRLVADSVAFDKLGESEFTNYKRRAFEACQINFGVDPTTLSNEGAELLGNVTEPLPEGEKRAGLSGPSERGGPARDVSEVAT